MGNAIGGDHNIIFTGGLAIGFCIFTCIFFVVIYFRTRGFINISDKKKQEK